MGGSANYTNAEPVEQKKNIYLYTLSSENCLI